MDVGGGVVHPNHPPVMYFGLTEETIKEGRFAFVYPGDCEGVLFPHEFEGALLALASKVPKGEMVAVEADHRRMIDRKPRGRGAVGVQDGLH